MNWNALLPPPRHYTGPKIPYYFLVLITIVSTARSLAHIFLPDGGAGIIAGIDLDVEGGVNIVAMFGQWGVSQLLLALVFWLAVLRYRDLTPLMLLVLFLEQLFRLGSGLIKPLVIAAPPPGAHGSEILLPLALVMLVWSLWPQKRE
jgi:hypothetical protein